MTSRRPLRGRARRRARSLAALGKAARFRDQPGFRRALADLARGDPARYARVAAMPLVAERLVALDSVGYGRQGGTPPPLPPLAADLRRLWHEAEAATAPAADALPPIDGDIEPKPSAWERGRGWLADAGASLHL